MTKEYKGVQFLLSTSKKILMPFLRVKGHQLLLIRLILNSIMEKNLISKKYKGDCQ